MDGHILAKEPGVCDYLDIKMDAEFIIRQDHIRKTYQTGSRTGCSLIWPVDQQLWTVIKMIVG